MEDTMLDAARGALLGALVGDAAGGVLEFMGKPTRDSVDAALRFPGGGAHGLAPGQITDDGELTLCLARGLRGAPRQEKPVVESIAVEYYRWMHSHPFDVGHTTMSSMGACHSEHIDQGEAAKVMRDAASARCMPSKANGSLMRCTPLGIWGHRMSASALAAWARADSSLSHPNPSCTDSVAAYVIALAHLMNHRRDHEGAIEAARTWTEEHACTEVGDWLELSLAGKPAAFQPQDGFVKIALTHAFHQLNRGAAYTDALADTLVGGGDTDTNACIVGGLIGALHGAEAIPAAWREAILTCNTSAGRARPRWLSASTTYELVDELLA